MKRTAIALPAAAVVLVVAFWLGTDHRGTAALAAPAAATGDGVVVEGTGETTGTPDVLRVTLGIANSGADVTAALNAASAQIARVHNQLVQDGTKAVDIQTSDLSIYPVSTKKGRRYDVSETLTAKLRDLHRAGAAISHAVAAGGAGISLQGVSFTLEDNAGLLDQARQRAFADARQKAERYAKLSGSTLGKVLLVSETTQAPDVGRELSFDSASAGRAIAPVPLYAGSSSLTVTVTVRWSLSG